MQRFKVYSPTRVDLAGGTLDIWPLYCFSGQAKTINVALNLCAIAQFEVSPSSRFKIEIQSTGVETHRFEAPLDRAAVLKLPASLQFPVYVASAYLAQKSELPPVEIHISLRTEAPVRSGLGGSSALCVALVRGLARVFDEFVEQGWQWAMLNWVKDCEAGFLKTATGTQDYLASLFGGLKCYVSRTGGIDCVNYPDGVLEALSERMVVLFSGEMHQSGLSNWELVKQAVAGDASVLGGLEKIRQIADQLDGELRGHLSWKHIGQYLTEEWNIRRDTLHVETKRLEEILSFLHSKKVHGAKVCGAAQGGSILALVEPSQKAALVKACQEAGIDVLQASANPSAVSAREY